MSWALKGLGGPLADKIFTLKPGTTLGRQGDIVIPDTKSSGVHARITESTSGRWVLMDNNSKNGTRIQGERISKVALSDGLKFYIGDQGFEVFEIKEEVCAPPKFAATEDDDTVPPPPPQPRVRASAPTPSVEPPPMPPPDATQVKPVAAPIDAANTNPPEIQIIPEAAPVEPLAAPPAPEIIVPKRRYWYELLADFVGENLEKFPESKKPVSPLSPALVLEFVRGLQANSKWTLGYGPRKVGSSALDLPIFEPGAPAVCFEIFPSHDGIVFKTAHPKMVTVNGESLDSRVLHVGDKIRINETIIEVDFEQ